MTRILALVGLLGVHLACSGAPLRFDAEADAPGTTSQRDDTDQTGDAGPSGPGPIERDEAGAADATVRINELLAHQGAGGFDDFVELINVSDAVVDLTGWTLDDEDSVERARTFVFPAGTTLAPGALLYVWCGADEAVGPLDASFGLGRNGDEAVLRDALGELVDAVSWDGASEDAGIFGRQESDVSLIRLPDGSDTWALGVPTPGESNEAVEAD